MGWGLEHPCGCRTELSVSWQRGTLAMAVYPGQVILGVREDSLKLLKFSSKLNLWPFYVAGPEHHDHPRVTHKNETSVAGEVWAHPGPVPMAGEVAPSPLQASSIRGFTSEAPAGLC